MYKTISFRANEQDLNMLIDLKEWLEHTWKDAGIDKKVNMSDVLFQAIINDWRIKCLPFKEKPYEFRAEKNLPFT